jgi:acyl-CoA thioester hydrolase
MIELLKNFSSITEINVQWGEMDAFQHVNNVSYIRYFESARIKYFYDIDEGDALSGKGIGVILAEISCKYKAPVTFPDTLSIGVRIIPESITEHSFDMHHVVYSHKLKRITTEGIARTVCYDYDNNRKASIPPYLKEKVLAFENIAVEV